VAIDPNIRAALAGVLESARHAGFLGPGPVEPHLDHALAFAGLAAGPPDLAVDLGSGAGLPGLALALAWPASRWWLVEAQGRRAAFLRQAAGTLGVADRAEVVEGRAEALGQDPHRRGRADLVVARSFGPPATVAECAAGFLRMEGVLIVAEPPGGDPRRWPAAPLALLGLRADGSIATPSAFQRLRQVRPCPERYPRRVGVPGKRPLWVTGPESG